MSEKKKVYVFQCPIDSEEYESYEEEPKNCPFHKDIKLVKIGEYEE